MGEDRMRVMNQWEGFHVLHLLRLYLPPANPPTPEIAGTYIIDDFELKRGGVKVKELT